MSALGEEGPALLLADRDRIWAVAGPRLEIYCDTGRRSASGAFPDCSHRAHVRVAITPVAGAMRVLRMPTRTRHQWSQCSGTHRTLVRRYALLLRPWITEACSEPTVPEASSGSCTTPRVNRLTARTCPSHPVGSTSTAIGTKWTHAASTQPSCDDEGLSLIGTLDDVAHSAWRCRPCRTDSRSE